MKIKIEKDPIIAWIILKRKYFREEGYFIDVLPIVIDWSPFSKACFEYKETEDGLECYDKFPDDAEVLAVIPAQPETYLVCAWVDKTGIILGIEVKGAYHPDWRELALEKYKSKHRRLNDIVYVFLLYFLNVITF